jgi:hypothetical protein
MKKIMYVAASAPLAAVAVIIALRIFSAQPVSAQNEASEATAKVLEKKIEMVKAAGAAGSRRTRETVEVFEVELESYVLYGLRDDIPARLDSIDVQLTDGAISADTKITFPSDSTTSLVDILLAGTHSFFVKAKLVASAGQGRFDLQEVKVDGIPVPTILVESLIEKYVKPKYPKVNIREPFMMPWGIESLIITPGKTTIVY